MTDPGGTPPPDSPLAGPVSWRWPLGASRETPRLSGFPGSPLPLEPLALCGPAWGLRGLAGPLHPRRRRGDGTLCVRGPAAAAGPRADAPSRASGPAASLGTPRSRTWPRGRVPERSCPPRAAPAPLERVVTRVLPRASRASSNPLLFRAVLGLSPTNPPALFGFSLSDAHALRVLAPSAE